MGVPVIHQPPYAATAFGSDIGGSGIKGATVHTSTGELITDRVRIATPHPATPDAVATVVQQMVEKAGWPRRPAAPCPAVIQPGVARSAATVDPSWIGTDADELFTKATG